MWTLTVGPSALPTPILHVLQVVVEAEATRRSFILSPSQDLRTKVDEGLPFSGIVNVSWEWMYLILTFGGGVSQNYVRDLVIPSKSLWGDLSENPATKPNRASTLQWTDTLSVSLP